MGWGVRETGVKNQGESQGSSRGARGQGLRGPLSLGRAGFDSCLGHLVAEGPWVRYLVFLSLLVFSYGWGGNRGEAPGGGQHQAKALGG